MKKSVTGIVCLCALLVIGLATVSHAKDVIKLSLNLAVPPTHQRWVKAIKPWIAEIETRSKGKIKIQPYFAQALSKQSDVYNSVVSGLADIGESPLDRKPGHFPVLENLFALATPSIVVKDGTLMFNELLEKIPQAQNDLKDTKILFVHLSAPACIGTSKVPVKRLEDLKGLKFNSYGILGKMVKKIGAVPIGLPFPDVYMAVEKGVLDASLTTYTLLTDRKFGKVLHHVTPVTFGYSPFAMVMNKKVWEKLPKDIQIVFNEVDQNMAINLFNKIWWERTIAAKKIFEGSMGGKTYYLASDDLAKMDKIWSDYRTKIVKRMRVNPQEQTEILSEFHKAEQKYGVTLNEAYGN